ncbi:hypothetical protein AM571_CH01449 [Rhizobium etli 8C-3]|uniref:Uncharacterized protein n=1 Tax=Rhizobium etli 8C-3 TaxID=538025 RepID=A0A1L5P299_RHIET|nr:hypothetical protein [Rhizobium etli]APO74284.1 hypothetical protein AM571_CH01449 [Rhizobium etli 8C-3]
MNKIYIPPLPQHENSEILSIINNKGGIFFLEGRHRINMYKLMLGLHMRLTHNCNITLDKYYTARPRPITYGLTSHPSLNAFAYASPTEDFDFVGLNIGVYFTLRDTFSRLLSLPQFLKDIGDSNKEDASRAHIPYLVTDLINQARDRQGVVPLCPVRAIYAHYMLGAALDFLFFHEVTHLRFGHLDWLRQREGASVLGEAIGETSSEGGLIRQALEMDADAGAILYTLNKAYDVMREGVPRPPNLQAEQALQEAYGSPEKVVRLIFSSVYILFRLFDCKEWDPFNQHLFTHPQSPLRQHWIALTIAEIFKNNSYYAYDADTALNDVAHLISRSEFGIAAILNDEPDFRGIQSVVGNSLSTEHLQAVLDAWAGIRDELLPFVRGGNLAPASGRLSS